jgi:hypothetical protein
MDFTVDRDSVKADIIEHPFIQLGQFPALLHAFDPCVWRINHRRQQRRKARSKARGAIFVVACRTGRHHNPVHVYLLRSGFDLRTLRKMPGKLLPYKRSFLMV